jgi:hypothetical protein
MLRNLAASRNLFSCCRLNRFLMASHPGLGQPGLGCPACELRNYWQSDRGFNGEPISASSIRLCAWLSSSALAAMVFSFWPWPSAKSVIPDHGNH